MSSLVKCILLIFAWVSASAEAGTLKIYWDSTSMDPDDVSAIQTTDPDKTNFVHINDRPVSFHTIPESVHRSATGRVTYSESIGYFDDSLLAETNRFRFEFIVLNGARILDGLYRTKVFIIIKGDERGLCSKTIGSGYNSGGCVASISMGLSEIDPELYRDLKALESGVTQLKNDSHALALGYESEITNLEAAIGMVRSKTFAELNEHELSFFKEAYDTFKFLKNSVTDLKYGIQAAQSAIQESVNETKERITLALSGHGIDAKNFDLYNFSQPLVELQVAIPKIPELVDPFDPNESRYDAFAAEVIGNLTRAWERGDRGEFLDITLSWIANNETFLPLLSARAVVSPGEWAAYQASVTRVRGVIFGDQTHRGYLDQDLWFKDSPVPPEFRRLVDYDIRQTSPASSKKLSNALKTWKGHQLTPEQARILETVRMLAAAFSAAGTEIGGGFRKLEGIVDGIVIMIKQGSACIAKTVALGDVGDLYEFANGVDLCSSEALNYWGRAISGASFFIGNAKILRAISNAVGLSTTVKTRG